VSESISVRCPYCGAEYTVPRTVAYATCPYCGTTFRLGRPEEKIEHYLFKAAVDEARAFRAAVTFASQQVGAEKAVAVEAVFASAKLYYVPIYIYEVSVKALCVENGEEHHGGESYGEYLVPAVDQIPIPLPSGYSFPARMREYFKPSISKSSVYLQPVKDPDALFEYVKGRHIDEAMREAREACPGSEVKLVDESKYVGLAHYPFWYIEYSYRGETFVAVVDASDGTVVYLEYPINRRDAAEALASSVTASIAAALIGASVSSQISSSLLGGLTGFAAFLPALFITFGGVLRRRGRYIYNPSEEAEFLPTR